ncbi:hypothetical protein ACQP1G_34160 [Nocardia sp. CA-107356]|uniref:hypothetical protein n=1 Tax=Nocardia sp. CA-107356 TaxID=3239972 RepID=UPI003D8A89F7
MTEQAEQTTVSDPEQYLAAAEKLILALPVRTEFINADVHNAMRADGWPELSEPRRFGPMLLRLRREGFIEKVGSRSTRARSHGGMTSVWRRTAMHQS